MIDVIWLNRVWEMCFLIDSQCNLDELHFLSHLMMQSINFHHNDLSGVLTMLTMCLSRKELTPMFHQIDEIKKGQIMS